MHIHTWTYSLQSRTIPTTKSIGTAWFINRSLHNGLSQHTLTRHSNILWGWKTAHSKTKILPVCEFAALKCRVKHIFPAPSLDFCVATSHGTCHLQHCIHTGKKRMFSGKVRLWVEIVGSTWVTDCEEANTTAHIAHPHELHPARESDL